jgi:hypothetical protein
MLQIQPELLKLYLDNGLRLPLNRICGGLVPQLYVRLKCTSGSGVTDTKYEWTIFYIGSDGSEKIVWPTVEFNYESGPVSPPAHTLSECLQRPEIAALVNDPERTRIQFSSMGTYTLESSDDHFLLNRPIFYAKCMFDNNGNIGYKYFFGAEKSVIDFSRLTIDEFSGETSSRDVDISASCYSYTVPPEDVISGRKIGYINQKEANAFLDRIRIAIDQLNNKLSGISTMIGVHNQDLQQNYTVATAAIEATEEAQQKTARNIH